MPIHRAVSRSRRGAAVRVVFATALAVVALGGAGADAKTWDHVANIKASAEHLAKLQQAKGALGAYEFIASCYKTHELAEEFGSALEGCLVQDYIHSKVTAAVYSRLPEGERQRLGVPAPEDLVRSMLGRVGGAMAKYKLKEADARKLLADIDKHGVPVFTKARFPKKAE